MSDNQEILPFGWSQAYNNYELSINVLTTITSSSSTTEEEFDAKYEVMEAMKHKANRYGQLSHVSFIGGYSWFALKTNYTKSKVAIGFLYTYWFQHIYTLGSHFGLFMNLKWAGERLNMGNQFQTGLWMQDYLRKVEQRQQQKSQKLQYESDSDILDYMSKMVYNQENSSSKKNKSYVQNEFFEKNYDQFFTSNPNDTGSNKIFLQKLNSPEEQYQLTSVPEFMNNFLTRYIYHNTKRWCTRFGLFLGVIKEQ